MVVTRTGLDLSKLSIYQVISNEGQEQQLVKPDALNPDVGSTPLTFTITTTTTTPVSSHQPIMTSTSTFSAEIKSLLDDETLKTSVIPFHAQPQTHSTNNNDAKELARIPYYNGTTNIYAWLTAIKSVFIDLQYDETTWANKAKYYLLDHAAQFVYHNDEQMNDWNTFRKLLIDRYSATTCSSDPTCPTITLQQQKTSPSDVLAVKALYALVLEDLKTLPKFLDGQTKSINSWLEEIELVYDKALISDADKCHRTLKFRFEGKKDSTLIQLEDDIRNRRYHDSESMHQYYPDIMRKCDLLEEEYPVSDRHRIDYITRGLPDSIQDQLLIREYSAPKELLEVLQKIEERRKRANFERHVISLDNNTLPSLAIATSTLQPTLPSTTSMQPITSPIQRPFRYNDNLSHYNQSQNYRPTSRPSSYYNHQQQSIQCYNCGRFGHRAADCFKPKQHLN
ncbi:unnamed protein product [Didymodactylos carnosus]|uniref:CCHC-type domain-containing protein n=1 Tax=Didymodactylos carnosus TaxID=1234261 RepID=A0A815ST73_9BILA|nr:unnamed protein product [Didymodactylos carnosus]CAF1497113.1 unnamed protein product [Didymodactylos carnosus]CAF4176115.1 unnamed protein product [Didymodactylos carnosus]CAF4359356.1 unnamed protein product [Didymodactylos carnosus]